MATEYRTKEINVVPPLDGAELSACCICGRPVKGKARHVHLVAGGSRVLHPDNELAYKVTGPHADDLGAWPIGPDCARELGLEWSSR